MRGLILSVLLGAIVAVATPALAGDPPKTEAALVDAAIDAISRSDVDAYLALFPTLIEMEAHCPKLMTDPRMRDFVVAMPLEAGPNIRAKMKRCHELIDFTKAERVRVEGGGGKKSEPETGCKDLYEMKDILVFLKVGEKTYRIMIDDPTLIGENRYGVMDDPRCSEE